MEGNIIKCQQINRPNSDTLWKSLPVNITTLLFTAVSWYLHIRKICWIGFCSDHYNHHACNDYKVSPASVIFLLDTALLASQYNWWPDKIHFGYISKIVFKVLVAALVSNFSERLFLYALHEFISIFLVLQFNCIHFIIQTIDIDSLGFIANFSEKLKSNTFHHICLFLVSIVFLQKLLNKDGFFDIAYEMLHHEEDPNEELDEKEMNEAIQSATNICERLLKETGSKTTHKRSKSYKKSKLPLLKYCYTDNYGLPRDMDIYEGGTSNNNNCEYCE